MVTLLHSYDLNFRNSYRTGANCKMKRKQNVSYYYYYYYATTKHYQKYS